jgi:SAM-dependent methyltransferase
MAFNATSTELLLLCRRSFPQALDFLMLGRQWLRLQPDEAHRLQQTYEVQMDDLSDAAMTDTVYAETLLQRMKLRSIVALDATAYQGAGLIHDLNTPLPAHLADKHDYVVDGGSLEHVFDFPTAIRNCAALLKPGGLFITICPVNNWMGHGFYQFSPELFFRVFDSAHGFSVRFAALHVRDGREQFFALRDPARVGHRVQYNPPGRTTLMLVAQKLDSPPAAIPSVQQSDYAERWDKGDTHDKPVSNTAGIKVLIPDFIRKPISAWRIQRRRTLKNQAGLIPCRSLAEAWQFWQKEDKR